MSIKAGKIEKNLSAFMPAGSFQTPVSFRQLFNAGYLANCTETSYERTKYCAHE